MISSHLQSQSGPRKLLLGVLSTLLIASTAGCGGGGGSSGSSSSSSSTSSSSGTTSSSGSSTSSSSGGSSSGSSSGSGSSGGSAVLRLPPENGGLDYQLAEPYDLPAGVTIVSRDKSAPIATGAYNICYINGFQTQPEEAAFWTGSHPELLLRDHGGNQGQTTISLPSQKSQPWRHATCLPRRHVKIVKTIEVADGRPATTD